MLADTSNVRWQQAKHDFGKAIFQRTSGSYFDKATTFERMNPNRSRVIDCDWFAFDDLDRLVVQLILPS